MDALLQASALVWLIAGVALILVEALSAPGLGLFLGGLGAVTTALLIQAGLVGVQAVMAQWAVAFGATTLWTVALWRPLQRFRRSKTERAESYHNVIGTEACVGAQPLAPNLPGQVMWSGTVMNALWVAEHGSAALPEGARVKVIAVSGTTLAVTPIFSSH